MHMSKVPEPANYAMLDSPLAQHKDGGEIVWYVANRTIAPALRLHRANLGRPRQAAFAGHIASGRFAIDSGLLVPASLPLPWPCAHRGGMDATFEGGLLVQALNP